MGKVLIIKGADFSAVAVADVVIDGKMMLTKDNYAASANGYLNTATSTVVPNSQGLLLFYPIRAGQKLFVPGNNTKPQICALVNVPEVGTGFPADAGFIARADEFPGDIIMESPKDCYVMLTYRQADTGTDVFPDGTYIANDVSIPPSLTEENIIFSAAKYMRENGTWGSETAPTGKQAAEFFLLHEGETVTIKANATSTATFAFINFNIALGAGAATFTQGEGRIVLQPGESQSYVVAKQCALYIYAYSGENVKFPESITVTNP